MKKSTKELELLRRRQNPRPSKVGSNVMAPFGFQNLRGFWPLSNLDENFDAYDISGQNRTLTATDVTSGLYNEKIPYAEYNGSSSKHVRASELGLEITPDITLGCWASVNSDVANQFLINKADDYSLYIDGNGNPAFRMIDAGSTLQIATSSVTVVIGNWYHIVGRMTASGNLDIIVNGVIDSVSALASIKTSNSNFTLGFTAASFGTFYMDGKIAWPFVAASAGSNVQIRQMYDSAKSAFKVYD